MEEKVIYIEDEAIQLEEVAVNKGKKLYRFFMDGRINGAPLKEIMENFPDYKFEPGENGVYDYFIEENGILKLYWPDGTPFSEDDLF